MSFILKNLFMSEAKISDMVLAEKAVLERDILEAINRYIEKTGLRPYINVNRKEEKTRCGVNIQYEVVAEAVL